MATTVKENKKKKRRLKRSVRKTLGTLLLISALVVAAIPVDGLKAQGTKPDDWGTLKENMQGVNGADNIPVITKDDTIYSTGDNKLLFALSPKNNSAQDLVAVILGYNQQELEGSRLEIPNVMEDVYLQLRNNDGTGRGYVAVSKKGDYLYYDVPIKENQTTTDPNTGESVTTEIVVGYQYHPCDYRDRDIWGEKLPSEFYYIEGGEDSLTKELKYENGIITYRYDGNGNLNLHPKIIRTIDSASQRMQNIEVWYIGNQYLTWNAAEKKWKVEGTVDYSTRDRGIFAGNTNLTYLEVGDNMVGIGDYAFYQCGTLDSIKLGNGTNTIGVGAFAECRNIVNIDIAWNANLSVIGDYAFYGCIALNGFNVPVGVKVLGDSVFEGCDNLININFMPNDKNAALSLIGTNVFKNCAKLESITFPPTFSQEVPISTFQGCANLKFIEAANSTVNFTGSQQEFDDFKTTVPETFYFKGLKTSNLHTTATNNQIAYSFFDDASGQYVYELTVVDDEGKKAVCWVDENGSLVYCGMDPGMTTVTLPEVIGPYPVKAIGANTFKDNCYLERITIPASMESIASGAFQGCHRLRDVVFANPEKLGVIGAGAFKTQVVGASHTTCPADNNGVSAGDGSIPYEPVKNPVLNFVGPISMDCQAFLYAMSPSENINAGGQDETYITYQSGWPTNLVVQYNKDTGKNTLVDYPTLKDMDSGNKYTSANYAYITPEYEQAARTAANKYVTGSETLTEDESNIISAALNIVLPEGIQAIGRVSKDENGNDLVDEAGNKIDYGLFEYGESKREFGTDLLTGGTLLRKTIVAEGIQDVSADAFKGAKYLKEITFSDKTQTIGDHAFDGCVVLEKVNLPATVTKMGKSPFRGCDILADVNFNGNPQFVCEDALIFETDGNGSHVKLVEYLSGRKPHIVEPSDLEGVTEIYEEAFMGSNIESADLSGSRISTVPASAFQDTSALFTVTLPDSCRTIAKDAFSDSAIRMLRVPNSVSVIHEKAFDDTTGDGLTDKPALTFVCVEGSVAELYAKENGINVRYILPVYTVTFYDTELKKVAEQYVEEGSPFTAPEDLENLPPTIGYTRLTWTPPSGTIVTGDLKVYAKYENLDPSEYQKTVVFYAFDKETVLSTQSVTPGEDAVPPIPPEVEGYGFIGWWPEDLHITDETENPYNLYAQYEKIDSADTKHSVRFIDYDDTVLLTLRVEDGKDAVIPPSLTQSMQNRTGFNFTGWKPLPVNVLEDMDTYAQYSEIPSPSPSTSPGPGQSGSPSPSPGTGSSNTGSGNTGSGNRTATPHTLTVRNGSGSGSYVPGSQIIIVANDPPADQEFGGWTVSPANTAITDTTMSAAIITMPDHDVAVIANYRSKSNGNNGGSTGSGSGSGSGTGGGSSSGGGSGSNRPGSGTDGTTNGGTTVVIDKNGLSNTGVVSATVNGSSDNFTIKITESSAAAEAVLRALLTEYGSIDNIKYFPMDISLYDATGEKKITDTTGLSITITLPLPDSLIPYAGNNKVAGVVNDKLDKLAPKFTTINGVSCITFTAEHFSPYVIYANLNSLSEGGGAVDSTPKTGDGIHPKWFLSIGLACLSFVFFMQKDGGKSRKKQKVKARA